MLDSLAPVEADPNAPGRVLFEPRELERQVDQLAAELEDLRERVRHLVGLVPGTATNGTATNGTTTVEPDGPATKKHKKRKKKAKDKAKGKKK